LVAGRDPDLTQDSWQRRVGSHSVSKRGNRIEPHKFFGRVREGGVWLSEPRPSLGSYWREFKAQTIVPWKIEQDFFRSYGIKPLPGARERRRLVDGAARDCGLGKRYSIAPWLNEVMYNLARFAQPEVIVETGVHFGMSSAYWLMALEANQKGTLYSIDLPTLTPGGRLNADGIQDASFVSDVGQTGIVVKRLGLTRRWNLRLGDAKVLLPPLLQELGQIGIFYHDSDHSYNHQLWEYRTAWPHLVPGGWLTSDDIQWTPAFADFARESGQSEKRWLNKFGVIQKGTAHPTLRPPFGP
jgi:hypothetical protein